MSSPGRDDGSGGLIGGAARLKEPPQLIGGTAADNGAVAVPDSARNRLQTVCRERRCGRRERRPKHCAGTSSRHRPSTRCADAPGERGDSRVLAVAEFCSPNRSNSSGMVMPASSSIHGQDRCIRAQSKRPAASTVVLPRPKTAQQDIVHSPRSFSVSACSISVMIRAISAS